jgi:predicted TIM-barrel fold metal-dependent hydrolase
MSKPKTIDVHAHFLPPIYQDALRDAGLMTLDGGIPTPTWSPERALAIMDEVGITGAVLSVSSPHLNFVDHARAITLARAINDYAADVKRRYPERFGAYAILPLPDVAASLAELDHALDELQLDGVALPTHAAGLYLGHARLGPLLAALDARKATVFVHPTSPPCFEAFGLELPAPMIEFPFDTTRTALSLLYSGALIRHPGIRFILPHAGGTLPFLAPRIAAVGSLKPVLGDRAMTPIEAMQALARFFFDTALSVTPQQMTALRTLAPISQVLYGTDFPFANEDRLRGADAAFDALVLAPEERSLIRRGNATPLFEAFAGRCCGVDASR